MRPLCVLTAPGDIFLLFVLSLSPSPRLSLVLLPLHPRGEERIPSERRWNAPTLTASPRPPLRPGRASSAPSLPAHHRSVLLQVTPEFRCRQSDPVTFRAFRPDNTLDLHFTASLSLSPFCPPSLVPSLYRATSIVAINWVNLDMIVSSSE